MRRIETVYASMNQLSSATSSQRLVIVCIEVAIVLDYLDATANKYVLNPKDLLSSAQAASNSSLVQLLLHIE